MMHGSWVVVDGETYCVRHIATHTLYGESANHRGFPASRVELVAIHGGPDRSVITCTDTVARQARPFDRPTIHPAAACDFCGAKAGLGCPTNPIVCPPRVPIIRTPATVAATPKQVTA